MYMICTEEDEAPFRVLPLTRQEATLVIVTSPNLTS